MSITLQELRELSKKESELSLRRLELQRAKEGFKHFIFDLKDIPETKGTGWQIKNGLLVVELSHDRDELMAFLDDKLTGKAWYEPFSSKSAETLEVIDKNYDKWLFKTLGKFADNPAMDLGIYIKNPDGSLSVQVITRFDGTLAFVGGMVEAKATILDKCIEELQEELYSNDLFADDSKTFEQASFLSSKELANALNQVLEHKAFSKLSNIKSQLVQVFANNDSTFAEKIKTVETVLKESGEQLRDAKNNPMRPADLDIIWVGIKCHLYAELFKDAHRELCSFITNKLITLDTYVNKADNRNTAYSRMVSTLNYILVKPEELKGHEDTWLVTPKGGDDAVCANLKRLEELFDKPMFSSHGYFALEMLVDIVEKNPEFLENPAFVAQIESIRDKIYQSERVLDRETNPNSFFQNKAVASKSGVDATQVLGSGR